MCKNKSIVVVLYKCFFGLLGPEPPQTTKHRSCLLHLLSHGLVGDVEEPTSLFEKSRGLSPVIVVWPEGDCSNWLTLLRYPCQKLVKLNK